MRLPHVSLSVCVIESLLQSNNIKNKSTGIMLEYRFMKEYARCAHKRTRPLAIIICRLFSKLIPLAIVDVDDIESEGRFNRSIILLV